METTSPRSASSTSNLQVAYDQVNDELGEGAIWRNFDPDGYVRTEVLPRQRRKRLAALLAFLHMQA